MAAATHAKPTPVAAGSRDEPVTAAELAHDLRALVALGFIALETDDDGELRARVRASAPGTAP